VAALVWLTRDLRLHDQPALRADRGPRRGAPRAARALPGVGRGFGTQASPPDVDTGRMSIQVKNGQPESDEITLELELTLDEAEALKAWLLKPAADGSAAIDDPDAKSVMVQLGAKLDFVSGVSQVRDELEEAGFETDSLSDEQIADLGRRIADTPIRRYSGKQD
jgi:hypothetical protein